jgi:hypothetical protein
MGRMKEVYDQIMYQNDGIPEGMTVGDMRRMAELEIYEWSLYEREKERARVQENQSDTLREIAKSEEAAKIFKKCLGETQKERNQ